MREAIKIKKMTRVIRPMTLARGMAVAGIIESGDEAIETFWKEIRNPVYGSLSRRFSAATVDAGFNFAISAVGNIGIPLALGAIVSAVGLPVLASGTVILAGSVLFGIGYQHFVQKTLWDTWKHSSVRTETIEQVTHVVDKIVNYVRDLKQQMVIEVDKAFDNFIQSISNQFSQSTP